MITAGIGTFLYSTPPSTSRPTVTALLPSTSSSDAANVACGQPSVPASIWPTWLASPSTACLPITTRSGFSAAMMPASTLTTTSESSSSSSATTWIARSAPIASVVRSSFAASSGTDRHDDDLGAGITRVGLAVLDEPQRGLDRVLVERVDDPGRTGQVDVAVLDLRLLRRVGDALHGNQDLHTSSFMLASSRDLSRPS